MQPTIPHSVTAGGTTVPSDVLTACDDHREHLALLDDDRGDTLTFGALSHRIDRIGAALVDRELLPGSVVAIWGPNAPSWLVTAVGALAAGCTVTGVSPLASDHEVAAQFRIARPALVVASSELAGRAVAIATAFGISEVVVWGRPGRLDRGRATVTHLDDLLTSKGASPDLAAVREDDVALLPFSSGTTGLPKGVELTHRCLVTMCRQISEPIPTGPGDRFLGLPPFAHVMGAVFTGLWPLSRGAAVVTSGRFDPGRFVPAIVERRLTHIVAPPLLAPLLATHPAATPAALAGVRLLGFGGAPIPAEHVRAVADRHPQATVGQGYGMTELTCVASVARLGDPGPAGSAGRPVPGTEIRVVDPDTRQELPRGTDGELLVRGPQVMAGYRGDPDATAATIDADGWLHTGDLGHLDHADNVFVVDRLKELIKVKGYQVPPAELEALLLRHPSVADAAVTAREVDGDQRPIAFVVPVATDARLGDELSAWIAGRVAPHKRLAAVHLTTSIPRNPNGKVLRRQLTEPAPETTTRRASATPQGA